MDGRLVGVSIRPVCNEESDSADGDVGGKVETGSKLECHFLKAWL